MLNAQNPCEEGKDPQVVRNQPNLLLYNMNTFYLLPKKHTDVQKLSVEKSCSLVIMENSFFSWVCVITCMFQKGVVTVVHVLYT